MIPMILKANEQILFQRGLTKYLDQSFNQVTANQDNPPYFLINEQGHLTYTGDGDFGVLYTKETYKNFLLELRLLVPAPPFQYVNSGIYFRHKDPLDSSLKLPGEISELALNRTAGFIADWSSYEVQLLAGEIKGDPIIKQNGAFYNIPIGKQEISEYRLNPGETYDIRLKVLEQSFEVYMKWADQTDYNLVSRLNNADPQKSFESGHIGIQSYYSNDREVKAFLFERISITPLR